MLYVLLKEFKISMSNIYEDEETNNVVEQVCIGNACLKCVLLYYRENSLLRILKDQDTKRFPSL